MFSWQSIFTGNMPWYVVFHYGTVANVAKCSWLWANMKYYIRKIWCLVNNVIRLHAHICAVMMLPRLENVFMIIKFYRKHTEKWHVVSCSLVQLQILLKCSCLGTFVKYYIRKISDLVNNCMIWYVMVCLLIIL
jgi:hypothetical protein